VEKNNGLLAQESLVSHYIAIYSLIRGIKRWLGKWSFLKRLDSSTNMVAVLATAMISLVGWLVWKRLSVTFPTDQLQFDPSQEPFVGPFQINAFLANLPGVGIVDTRAQRMGHLCMMGLLGVLILLRQPLLRLARSSPTLLMKIIFGGIVAAASIWTLLTVTSIGTILPLSWFLIFLGTCLLFFLGDAWLRRYSYLHNTPRHFPTILE
jgi:hypothetical protein